MGEPEHTLTISDTLIKVDKLEKTFGDIVAVKGITFSIGQGEIFGFLGPNGAGKTTTINMLTGLCRPDAGNIEIAGRDCVRNPKKTQHLMGVVPDESNLYPELTGFENLCFCAALYGIPRAERQSRANELLDHFRLRDAADRKFAGYSKGMKRKLTIAAGIIHQPRILFLDEPTTGIDVASARQIRQLISNLNQSGTTIFLTTHYIEEAERLCDRIAFIVRGEIIRIETVENLMQPSRGRTMMQLSLSDHRTEICEMIMAEFPNLHCRTESKGIRVESYQAFRVGQIVRFLENAGIEVFEARKIRPTLEDVFVEITGIEAGIMKQEIEKAKPGGGI